MKLLSNEYPAGAVTIPVSVCDDRLGLEQIKFVGANYAFIRRFLPDHLPKIMRHPVLNIETDGLCYPIASRVTRILDKHRELLNFENFLQTLGQSVKQWIRRGRG